MQKINFEMHQNLLKSVIFEQAGSILKAIEECIQNSLDADATSINLEINSYGFTFTDNGNGMSKETILNCFKTFGYSEKDNDKIGKFGMGRGQVFSFGYNKWRTQTYQMRTNVIRKLTFSLKENLEYVKGTKIICVFYKQLHSYELRSTIEGIKHSFIPVDTNFTINNKKIEPSYKINNQYSTKDFIVFESEYYTNKVFAQNLFVNTYDSTANFNINCLNKMKLNFARNSFLENDNMTKKLNVLINEIEKDILINKKQYDATTGRFILNQILKNKFTLNDFIDKKIIEQTDGSLLSLREISNKQIIFGKKNAISDRAIQYGFIVINRDLRWILDDLRSQNIINFEHLGCEPQAYVPTGFRKQIELEQLYKTYGKKALIYWFLALEMNQYIFNNERDLYIGFSDYAKAWTDGYDMITINCTELKKYKDKGSMIFHIFNLLAHEYSHDDDNTNETAHDANFYKRFYKIINKKQSLIGYFILSSNLKQIEKDYIYEVNDAILFSKNVKKLK